MPRWQSFIFSNPSPHLTAVIAPSTIVARERTAAVGFTADTPDPVSGSSPLVALAKLLLPIGAFAFVLFHHAGKGLFEFDDDFKSQARTIAKEVMDFLREQGIVSDPAKMSKKPDAPAPATPAPSKNGASTKVATRDIADYASESTDHAHELPSNEMPIHALAEGLVWETVAAHQPPSLARDSRKSTSSTMSRESRRSSRGKG